MTAIVVHGFDTSNNIKVRVALGYKGIPYEFRVVDPRQREDLIRISGQFLTPVLEHEGRVLFDSAAILRYLDANFPDTPKLFGRSMAEQWEIEDWELFARTQLAGPMMEVVHSPATGATVDDAMRARCEAAFGEAATHIAEHMRGRTWMVGDAMTAADVTAAAVFFRIRSAELFRIPETAAPLTDWIDRVMAWDGVHRS